MSIAAMSSFGTAGWEVQSRNIGSADGTQQSNRTSGSAPTPQGSTQEFDEFIPSQGDVEEMAATYGPPPQGLGAVGVPPEETTESSESTETAEDVKITVQASGAPAAEATEETDESEETESSTSAETTGKPSWISDEHWTEIQENPNQQPSDMSDEDWQAYLEWAGKSSPADARRQQPVSSEQPAVIEGMPPGAASSTVTTERAEATTLETTTQSAQESGNRFGEYANRYSRWNSGNMNVGTENRINVTA